MIDDLDLMAEWLVTSSLNSKQRRQLLDLGVTREAIHRTGGLACARVSTIGGRCYTPSHAGDVMVIQPVWAGPAPSIYQAVEHPVIFDLIAWHPDRVDKLEQPELFVEHRLFPANDVPLVILHVSR